MLRLLSVTRGPAALVLLSGFAAAPPPPTQEPPVQKQLPTPRQQYGPAQPAELAAVALSPDSYQRRNVVTRGYLEMFPDNRWMLSEGGARLLLIPVVELSESALRAQVGHRVEVTGIIRVLPQRQGTCSLQGQRVPESLCDDPYLPVLPDRQPDWPPGSITATGMMDIENYRAGERRPATSTIADALARPPESAGKSVRVVGRFRGANLFGDLPASTRRSPGDWVLQDGEQALWVTGRPPKGKGFDLDPSNKSDTGRWLEVQGKIVTVGAVAYLKASRVQMVAAPAPRTEDKP